MNGVEQKIKHLEYLDEKLKILESKLLRKKEIIK